MQALQPKLDQAFAADKRKPDEMIVPKRNAHLSDVVGEYWNNPFIRG
jgi:hypothetical protein